MIIFLSSVFSHPLQANNIWTQVGELVHPRSNHSATTLNTDQVLITGGVMNTTILDSTEMFDPTTGLWTLSSSMISARKNHASVLLNDGRILVVGGSNATGDLNSVEAFDPQTSNWTSLASMSTPRANALVTRLSDGRVLVSSGVSGGTALNSAEIYDPSTDSWNTTDAMVYEATHARDALLLNDGRVFIIGLEGWAPSVPGTYDPPTTPTRMPQIYNPATNSWSVAAARAVQQRWGTNIVLPDGRVLSTGGERYGHDNWGWPVFVCNTYSEIYDPQSDTWSYTRDMLDPKGASFSSVLPNGAVLAHGSCDSGNGTRSHLYDPVSGSWSLTGQLAYAHTNGARAVLSDGSVLVSGGSTPNIAELFTPSNEPPPPPSTVHVSDIDAKSFVWTFAEGVWKTSVTVRVVDQDGNPVPAWISGVWSNGVIGSAGCGIWPGSSSCNINSDSISFDIASTAFTIANVTSSGRDYDPDANTDSEGDSDGNSIVIQSPPPPPPVTSVHIGDLDKATVFGSTEWTPGVAILVHNNLGKAAVNATVTGTWSNRLLGTSTCTTGIAGTCTILYHTPLDYINDPVGDFTISDITWDYPYASADNTDPDGSTDGTHVSFLSPAYRPGDPLPDPNQTTGTTPTVHIADLDGSGRAIRGNRWRARVYITAKDSDGNAVAGATVTGNWSGGTSGSSECTTGSTGRCRVSSNRISNSRSTATFSVTTAAHPDLTYDASQNTDSDGDSNGTSITVYRP